MGPRRDSRTRNTLEGTDMDDLRDKYLALIGDAGDEAALEELRVQAVG